jgi:predicted Ser/Thr protein kinase
MASQNEQFPTVGPHSIFSELRKMVKRPMDFEYLRLEPNHGYHAFEDLIDVVRHEWLNWVDREMRVSLDLQDDQQFIDYLGRYTQNIIHHVRGEKIKNRLTGQAEDPSQDLMQEFEQFVGLSTDADEFRKNLITRIGAWSLENPGRDKSKTLPFDVIFPDLMEKLRNKHHENQISKIKAMGELMIDVNTLSSEVQSNKLSETAQMAIKAYKGLQSKFGYGPLGAKEALIELIKSRYV